MSLRRLKKPTDKVIAGLSFPVPPAHDSSPPPPFDPPYAGLTWKDSLLVIVLVFLVLLINIFFGWMSSLGSTDKRDPDPPKATSGDEQRPSEPIATPFNLLILDQMKRSSIASPEANLRDWTRRAELSRDEAVKVGGFDYEKLIHEQPWKRFQQKEPSPVRMGATAAARIRQVRDELLAVTADIDRDTFDRINALINSFNGHVRSCRLWIQLRQHDGGMKFDQAFPFLADIEPVLPDQLKFKLIERPDAPKSE